MEPGVYNPEPSIARAEKKIKTLTEKVGASEEGMLWIKEVMDPFSDTRRRTVGFPDLITGNSVIQVVKRAITLDIGATAQDVHIFLDTLDTAANLTTQPFLDPADPESLQNAVLASTVAGVDTHSRGGLVIRKGPVGGTLNFSSADITVPIPNTYVQNGTTRVIAKAFEVHNTSNKLNVGGAVTVYRDTGPIPSLDEKTLMAYGASSTAYGIGHTAHTLSQIPNTLAKVTNIPGSQTWEAEDGAYVVATMASQTNNPVEEHHGALIEPDLGTPAGKLSCNIYANPSVPQVPRLYATSPKMFSPFFLCGAYFTGLPPNSQLTINVLYVLERFVSAENLDLVVLAQPSPFYDPVALELYSRAAQRMPHGVKVGWNASGDWIKSVADILGTFGVPGMPIVKGAVDVYNAVTGNGEKREEKRKASESKDKRIRELEEALARHQSQSQFGPSVGQNRVKLISSPQTKVVIPKRVAQPKLLPNQASVQRPRK